MDAVKMTVAAKSDVGRARDHNEDAFAVSDLGSGTRLEVSPSNLTLDLPDQGVLLALSDGMGGHQAGEVASALVLDALASAAHDMTGDSMPARIEAAVRRANAEVVDAARATNRKGMGATLTAVFVAGHEAYFAEVGDSRGYVLRAGRLRQMTRDQSLVQMLIDTGAITPEQAALSSHKNIILQAVGLAEDVRVAIGRLHLRRGDTIFVCCDGVSNAIRDEEMQTILTSCDPAAACARMIDLANERGGKDNLTAIVALFEGEGLQPPSARDTVSSTFEVLQEFAKDTPRDVEPSAPGKSELPRASKPPAPVTTRTEAPAPRSHRSLVTWGLVVAVVCALAYFLLHR